jgi:hypothetical protein
VTQALEPLFDWSRVPPAVLENKRRIGKDVHKAIHIELTAPYGVDLRTIKADVLPYFQSWLRFRNECEFDPRLVEHKVTSDELGEDLRYAGTLDEWGYLQGSPALIDWKTSMLLNVDGVGAQTAAYLKALVRSGIGALSNKRFALKLGADGRYELERFRKLDDDWQRFVKCLKAKVSA